MSQGLPKGIGIVFGPDEKRDYGINYSDLEYLINLGYGLGADHFEIRFFADPEQRSRRLLIPEEIFTARQIIYAIDCIKKAGFGVKLHISQEIIPCFENPRKLGYAYLKQIDQVTGHLDDIDFFMRSLRDYIQTEAARGSDEFLAPLGEPSIVNQKLRKKFSIENTWRKIKIAGIKRKVSTAFFSTAYLAANTYHIKNTLDLGHFSIGLDPNNKFDNIANYARFVGGKLKLTDRTKRICKNTNHLHVHGIEVLNGKYYDHITLKRPGLSNSIPRRNKQVLYGVLEYSDIDSYTIELRKKYHTLKNFETTANNFEKLLDRIKNGN